MLLKSSVNIFFCWICVGVFGGVPLNLNAKSILGSSEPLWYQGTVTEAFTEADKHNKLVFLYWGAEWCPPCNQLKNAVFSRPRFAELMQSFIPVYLNGDTEAAQQWGQKFSALGYPTLIVLDGEYKELTRISGSVDINEFEHAISGYINDKETLAALMARAKAGQNTRQFWQRLAYMEWVSFLSEKELKQAEAWCTQILKNIPASMPVIRSQFYTQVLSQSTLQCDKSETDRKAWLDTVFSSESAIIANRNFINDISESLLNQLQVQPKTKAYAALKERWLAAATSIKNATSLPIDDRLASQKSELVFYQFEHQNAYSKGLADKVKAQYAVFSERVSNEFEAHFVVTISSDLLRMLEDYEGAAKILTDALPKSKAPWYLQSKLATLAKRQNNLPLALSWAEKARNSARGRATKLQWIQQEIELIVENYEQQYEDRLVHLVESYYQIALQLADGFAGRNLVRQKKLAAHLHMLKQQSKKLTKTLAELEKKCAGKVACQSHFRAI